MRRFLAGILVVATATGTACSKTPESQIGAPVKAAEDSTGALRKTVAPAQPSAGRAIPATTPPATPRQPVVKSVDYEQLQTFLPELAGWTAENVRGEELTTPAPYSRAEARYRKDEARLEIEIIDTGMNPLLLAPLSMFVATGYSERYDHGFRHAARLSGQPGAEDWNGRTNRGEVTAIAGNRYVVRATGHHLGNIEPIRDVVEAMNLTRLSALR